jgi:hypothetical protein
MATVENLVEARRVLGDAVGLREFKDYVRAEYGEIADRHLREFQRKNVNSQLFGPPPASEGKMATLGPKDHWYLDLMSMPTGDKTYKHILTAQNVYSGYLYAAPLKSTTPSGPTGSAAVFEEILNQSARDGQGPPKTITTDGSTVEWSREFATLLAERGIIRRPKEPSDANAMGKLDATQNRLRALLRPKVDGSNEKQDWSERLPGIVETYNNRLGHEGSFGSRPKDVISKEPKEDTESNALDFQVMRQMARNLRHNTLLNEKNRDAALAEGALRTSVYFDKDKKFDKGSRITRIRYSEDVRQVDGEEGPYVKDTSGELHNPKLVKPVPVESQNVKPPPELKRGTYDKRIEQKEKLWEVAKILHAWLKTQHEGAANITITNRYKNDPLFRAALNPGNVQLGFLNMGKKGQVKKIVDKPVAIAKLFEGWFVRKNPKNPKDQMWLAKGTMPEEFQAKPEEAAPSAPNARLRLFGKKAPSAPEQPPLPSTVRLRGKQNPASGAEEFRVRYLVPLRTWLAKKRIVSAADFIRFLRGLRAFPAFAKTHPFYAKASNIVSQYQEFMRIAPGGTTRNPRIASKEPPLEDLEAPPTAPPEPPPPAERPAARPAARPAERRPLRIISRDPDGAPKPGEVPKGPRRLPGGPAGTGLGAVLARNVGYNKIYGGACSSSKAAERHCYLHRTSI